MGKRQEQGRGNARLLLQVQLLAIAISFLGFRSCCAYMIYRVGDGEGWTSTASGVDYTKWASQKPFTVGDYLVFAYESGHSVLQTSSEEAYEKCNVAVADGKILSQQGSNEANVQLDKPGKTYFFCTASGGSHCRSGMKFAIDVLGSSSLAPSGSPAATIPSSISPSASDQPVDSTGIPSSPSGSIITTPSSSSGEKSSPKSAACRLAIPSLNLLAAMALTGAVLLFLS